MSYPQGAPLGQETTSRKAGKKQTDSHIHFSFYHNTNNRLPLKLLASPSLSPFRLPPHTAVVLTTQRFLVLCQTSAHLARSSGCAVPDRYRARVLAFVDTSCCVARSMKGKAALLELFLDLRNRMTKEEAKASPLSVLSVCTKVLAGKRTRSKGERQRFDYAVPIDGSVCRATFASCYDIGDATLTRYRRRTNKNEIFVDPHKGLKNANAAHVGRETLAGWFSGFANSVEEATPLRRRRREAKDGDYYVKYESEQRDNMCDTVLLKTIGPPILCKRAAKK